jgi:hypothetical protein
MTPIPPVTPPTQAHPNKRWSLDQGVATVVGAIIGVAGSLLVVHFTTSSSTPSDAASTPSSTPASVSIYSPASGNIHWETSFAGDVTNLHPGESVWVFYQAVDKRGNASPMTFPTRGPCAVNFAKNTWKCDHVYVGKPTDKGKYRICPAVLNFSQSNEVVRLLQVTAADPANQPDAHPSSAGSVLVEWFASPPSSINPQSCISVPRIN